MIITDPLPTTVNVHFASNLEEKKDAIISEWLGRVRTDPAIRATEILNTVAIKNHLPQIFDDLTESLRSDGSEKLANDAAKDAEEHGAARMRQGYELTEMLREIKHLRGVLIYHLRFFEDQYPDYGMADRLLISSHLHAFLDQLMIDSTEEFLWSKMTLQERVHLGYVRR